MSEFSSRIEIQREVLSLVNKRVRSNEPLFGLSEKAILRWVSANGIESGSEIVILLKDISGKLFFLANKSQEQVTEDYRSLSVEVRSILGEIEDYAANNGN